MALLLCLEANHLPLSSEELILVPSFCLPRSSMKIDTCLAFDGAFLGDHLRGDVCCWSPFLGFSGEGNVLFFIALPEGSLLRRRAELEAQGS